MKKTVVHFKCVKELDKNLVFSLSSEFNIWVMFGIIDILEIIEFNNPIAVFVKLLESSLNKLLSLRVHLTDHNSDEFIIADRTIMIEVKDAEQDLSLILGQLDSIVLEGFEKFLGIKLPVVVVINNLENSSQTDDSTGTSLSHLISEFLKDLLI